MNFMPYMSWRKRNRKYNVDQILHQLNATTDKIDLIQKGRY